MRIAFLTHEPFFPPSGGGSAEATFLVPEFVRRGHSVDVFGPELPDSSRIEREFGIRHRGFRAWRMGRYATFRTPKYLAYPFALERMVLRASREIPYDLLFSQHAISAVAAGRLGRRLRVPVVMNFLDCLTGFLETWPPWLMPRPLARALVRFELAIPRRSRAEAVLTVSDPLRDRFVEAGTPPERVHPIYYGYAANLFRRASDTTISSEFDSGPPTVVMHGSFDHHHLGPIARRAVLETVRRRPDVRFRFVGRVTPALRGFLDAIQSAAPAFIHETTGFVPYDQIPELLASATLGITPYELSTGTHCAFVAKTIEYLALGLPVVSTPLESSVRYYAGSPGIAFSAPDGSDFAKAILDWIQLTYSQRITLTNPTRGKIESELDWSRLCRRAVDLAESAARRAG